MRRRAALALLAALLVPAVEAHVGSPDAVYEGAAGPYSVRVVVRMPVVIPGQAEVTIRVLDGAADAVAAQPVRWDAPKDGGAPPPDRAHRVRGDEGLFSASLWLMTSGSYAVRVEVDGKAGHGTALVPIVAVATRALKMNVFFGALLLALGGLLYTGAVSVVGAAVREAGLPVGEAPDAARRRRGWIAAACTAVALGAALWGGWHWWAAEAAAFGRRLYRPLGVTSTVRAEGAGHVLHLAVDEEEWRTRGMTPLAPDHGKLMHLFLIREPGFDVLAHLHPERIRRPAAFDAALPRLPAGRYRLYGDIVHESGFAQTLVATVTLPEITAPAAAADPDDSWAQPKVDAVDLGDGYSLTREADTPLVVKSEQSLRFRLRDAAGSAVVPEPYMGMAAHAVLLREDGSVFIHLHPTGTISMASQMLFHRREAGAAGTEHDPHAGHPMAPADEVLSFPYQFPKAGRYRMWVQTKVAGVVRTAAYDLSVLANRP